MVRRQETTREQIKGVEKEDWGVIQVAVATLWTSPQQCEPMDQLVLGSSLEMEFWLSRLTWTERLRLWETKRIQSQLLLGTPVRIVKEAGEWSHVLVPSQPSRKHPLGYPGWIPTAQIRSLSLEELNLFQQVAHYETTMGQASWAGERESLLFPPFIVVQVPFTPIFARTEQKEMGEFIPLSYQTRLPLIQQTGAWYEVLMPTGIGILSNQDVVLVTPTEPLYPPFVGAQLVERGLQFLGLPYLWGGNSAYGYDCSGFVYSLHRSFGLTIPRDAADQFYGGEPVAETELMPGDLLFFAQEEGGIHHVGIYAGDGKMLHTSMTTGREVEMVPLAKTGYHTEYAGARRYWTEMK